MRLWRAGASHEQRAPSSRGPLTLGVEQAVELALQNNPSLRELDGEIEITRATVDEDAQLENPQIRLRDFEVDKAADGVLNMDLALRVPVPRPWVRDARLQRARLRVEEASARRADLTRRIRAAVHKCYAKLAALDQEVEEAERTIVAATKYREMAEQRVRDGATTRIEVSRTILRHADALDLRHELRIEREETIGELLRLIGARPDQRLTFRAESADLSVRKLALDQAELIGRALSSRLDLREAESKVGIAEAEVYMAKAERWPWLRFAEVGYRLRSDLDPRSFEIAVALDIPLLSWNRGAIAVREATLARRRVQEQAAALAAAIEVSEASARVRETSERIRELERTLLPSIKADAQVLEEGLSRGVVDPQRAMVVEWRRNREQTRYLRALLEHREAVIDLEAAVGSTLTSEQP